MIPWILFVTSLWTSFPGADAAEATATERAFERLRGLAGDWTGTLEWTGARTGTGEVSARYGLTGGGSAVVEDLVMAGSVPSMTSVYHLDGADLRMTHYCGAQNQPRLKAIRVDDADGILDFSFVDATGLDEHPAHVTALEIRFLGDGRLELRFTFEGAGKTSVERIQLRRASPKNS